MDARIIRLIREHTDLNDVGAACETAARALGLLDLADKFVDVRRRHIDLGHLSFALQAERRALYEEMMREAKSNFLQAITKPCTSPCEAAMKIIEPTGELILVSQHGLFLASPGDAWGKEPALWVDHPDFALGCTRKIAELYQNRLAFKMNGKFNCRIVTRKQAERIANGKSQIRREG